MDKQQLEARTKAFALQVINFTRKLDRDPASLVLSKQLLRSATSIGANYREANRAESKSDFIHKLALVEKEAAETKYWIELLEESHSGERNQVHLLKAEATELLAIFTSSLRTLKSR